MKNTLHRIILLFCMAIMVAFTLVPPPHQVPDNNRSEPVVVYQKPPVGTLTLSTAETVAVRNEEVCVAVTATGFDEILTMQYSINWDPNVLKFKYFKNFGLKGMDARNFGQHLLDKGILTFSWYDQQLVGISHDDGKTIYELCFDAIGESGSETTLDFTSKPTVIEVVNSSSVFLDLRADSGKITIQ